MSTSPMSSTNAREETTSERIRAVTSPLDSKLLLRPSTRWSPGLYARLEMKRHMPALLTGLLDPEKFLDLMESKIEEATSLKAYWEAK